MAKRKADEDLVAYLNEHLKYERDMLRFTYKMLFQMDGLRWCAMFESFGMHARNLYDFLRHEGNAASTFRADDYVQERRKPKASNVDSKMNISFFHLSASRLDKKAVNLDDAVKIGEWIDKEWAIWVAQLGEPFKALVDISPACPAPSEKVPGPSATNHITTTGVTVVHNEKRGS